ncbi:MAG: Uma2 family endonuclease [Clostridia bacterium]|nr:Uma2 family endonuclease [Clostridia bacterium]
MSGVSGAGQRPLPAGRVSYQEYLNWLTEDTWAEWVEGEVRVLSPASRRHQEVVGFLAALLRLYLDRTGLGVVLTVPFVMHTAAELPAREPDLFFVAQEHMDRLKKASLEGPADLVVEVVSPDSRLRDRGEKFAEYEMGGVREYWLIDPEAERADFYVLASDGRYRRVEPDADGVYGSTVLPGFRVRVQWFWQVPPPSLWDVAAELAT